MKDITFNEELILKINGKKQDVEVLAYMAEYLQSKGLVKDSYSKAITDREAEFPTGLFTGNINIAIPHADTEHVEKAAICVGVLEEPIIFRAMDDPDKELEIRLIIMLALKEAHGHIEMLQKVVELIKDQEALNKVIESSDSSIIYQIISEKLL